MSPYTLILFIVALVMYVTASPYPGSSGVIPDFKTITIHTSDGSKTIKDANKGPSITIRSKRSPDDDWIFRPDLSRDDRGNTRGEARVEKHGDDYDINAQYGQTFRGPDKHSEAWHIGGSFRW
ncbi:uncharacterized protein LOC143195884 [Rhynchophorus ferrugineus]|uniref:Coleoptericin n=1 Tax=Rhynchophorus ferrugineus TaxID=354439 RepID=A0A9E9FXD5_RHYFE|nr:coleoptericin [Rhynchophorus ferrugineus]